MTYPYVETPETRLNDLIRDVAVAGYLAKDRKLDPDYAGHLAARVKAAATAMLEPGDAQLLKTTANTLERASTRIKAGAPARRRTGGNGSRAKAAPGRPEPDYAAMIRQQDAEQMSLGGPFDRDQFEDVQRRRSETQNAMLRERQRKLEAQRRAQVRYEQPETPWWR